MSQARDEDRLRAGFQRLREETERPGGVPEFATMLAKAKSDSAAQPALAVVAGAEGDGGVPRRRRVLRMGGWASLAAAAAIAGVLLVGGRSNADAEFERLVASYSRDVVSGALSSPTSGLLDVPGMNLTRSVPSIGGSLRGLDPSARPDEADPQGRDS